MSSQHGQDRVVLSLLGGLRAGFFLDSGASNGVRASNTQLLERDYGWTGICVEPNREMYAELVANRGCTCINCCLWTATGEVEFVEAHTMGGILTAYDPGFLRHVYEYFGTDRIPTVLRPARTVGAVLREHGAPPVIDYWSLDTEGSELAILESFPFDEYAVRVLTVEHNWTPARSKIARFLADRGLVRVREIVCDDCYVNPALVSPASWRSHARVLSSRTR